MYKQYKRSNIAELRPYIKGEDQNKISVSKVDDPETDMGMVARNPDNHLDQWYVARKYFEDNFELISTQDITITKKEYDSLLEAQQWLNCLEDAGVDNWSGIDYAQTTYHEQYGEDE